MVYRKPTVISVVAIGLFMGTAAAQSLTSAQIMQVEEVAKKAAEQHNANANAMLDEVMVSTHATAVGRNIQFKYVFRLKKNSPKAKLNEFTKEIKNEVVTKSCAVNANNPFFERGLSYMFVYFNTYGEHLTTFTVNQAVCKQSH